MFGRRLGVVALVGVIGGLASPALSLASVKGTRPAADLTHPAGSVSADIALPASDWRSLASSTAKVTSSTGKSLYVTVSMSVPPNISGKNVTVSVSDKRAASSSPVSLGETHSWLFIVPVADFVVNTSGGGTLDVPESAISPLGAISLGFVPSGAPVSRHCADGSEVTTQKVSLSGTLALDTQSTGSHSWGVIGSESKHFAFPSGNVAAWGSQDSPLWGNQTFSAPLCKGATVPCQASVSWRSSGFTSTSAITGSFLPAGPVSLLGYRSTSLGKPAGATRGDRQFASAKTASLKHGKSGSVSLSVAGSGTAHGSARLNSVGSSTTATAACGGGKVATTHTWKASYVNGKSPLSLNEQVFGSIREPNSRTATISEITVRKS